MCQVPKQEWQDSLKNGSAPPAPSDEASRAHTSGSPTHLPESSSPSWHSLHAEEGGKEPSYMNKEHHGQQENTNPIWVKV